MKLELKKYFNSRRINQIVCICKAQQRHSKDRRLWVGLYETFQNKYNLNIHTLLSMRPCSFWVRDWIILNGLLANVLLKLSWCLLLHKQTSTHPSIQKHCFLKRFSFPQGTCFNYSIMAKKQKQLEVEHDPTYKHKRLPKQRKKTLQSIQDTGTTTNSLILKNERLWECVAKGKPLHSFHTSKQASRPPWSQHDNSSVHTTMRLVVTLKKIRTGLLE